MKADVLAFLQTQAEAPLTYQAVGATAGSPPQGFVADHRRIQLGKGEESFALAQQAIQAWQPFHIGWMSAVAADDEIRSGGLVGVLT
jgi:uncharacterized protein (UPF0548 family)